MRDPKKRMSDYEGRGFYFDEMENAGLDDVLTYLEFEKDVRVRDVMSTRSLRLCYRY